MNFRAKYLREIERLRLDEDMCPYAGMASAGEQAEEEFLAHLRTLVPGATWRDVFPDMPAHWDLDDPDTWTSPIYQHALGTFDYPNPPRGIAVFAGLPGEVGSSIAAGNAALDTITTLGIPIYGAGLVLDRGAPHMYVVLPLGSPTQLAEQIADFLREQPGIGNAYPVRFEPGSPRYS
jgi:hypothetical protein